MYCLQFFLKSTELRFVLFERKGKVATIINIMFRSKGALDKGANDGGGGGTGGSGGGGGGRVLGGKTSRDLATKLFGNVGTSRQTFDNVVADTH